MLGWIAETIGQATKMSVDAVDTIIEDIKDIPDAFERGYDGKTEEQETAAEDQKVKESKTNGNLNL